MKKTKQHKAKIQKKNQEKRDKQSALFSTSHIIIGVAIVVVCLTVSFAFSCLTKKVCHSLTLDRLVRNYTDIELPKGKVYAEIVDTKASRELGLSGRTEMKKDEGMLFVFDDEGRFPFWMKDMQFPIDILWISEGGVVVHVVKNATPESYPSVFVNQLGALYVLELQAGAADEYGIILGSKVSIDKTK